VSGRAGSRREMLDADVLLADQYLEALLAAAERQAPDAPSDASMPSELRDAARLLRRSLVRIHPSFRFEERVAQRLAGLAGAQARQPGGVIPFAGREAGTTAPAAAPDPLLDAILAGRLDPADSSALDVESRLASARRPLLVGGALTSAAISIVGVAWVAWRAGRLAGREPATAMGRAARAAHARQAMSAGLSGGGVGGPA
jgi:hypothetical protein